MTADSVIPNPPTRLRWLAPLLILGAVLTAFEPALEGGFVNWDDDKLIERNAALRGFSSTHLRWMFTTNAGGHWQPLTWLSYAADDALHRAGLWSLEAFGYHLTNVLLHAVSAVLVYFIARRLIHAASSDTLADPRSFPRVVGAGMAALVFAVHPLRAESVAWVTERRDVLSMALLLGSTLCWLRSLAGSGTGARSAIDGGGPIARGADGGESSRGRSAAMADGSTGALSLHWRLFSVALFVLALMAKASAMVLPAALVVMDAYPLRRWRDAQGGTRLRRLLLEKTPMWLAAAGAAAMAWGAQRGAGAAYTLAEYPLTLRLAQACRGLAFYVYKTVVPVGLGPLIQIPSRDELLGWKLWPLATLIVAVGAAAWRGRRRHPWAAAGLALYGLALAPVLGFFQSGPQLVADRYSYLACLPLAVIAGGAAARAFGPCAGVRLTARAGATLLVCAAAVTGLHRLTSRQAEHWQDSLSLWRQAIRACPTSSIAHVQYANELAHQALGLGDIEAMHIAMDHYRYALSRNPKDVIAWHYLGRALLLAESDLASLSEARAALHRAIALNPQRAEAFGDLASVYRKLALHETGDATAVARRALDVLREGVAANPRDVSLLNQLATLLTRNPDPSLRDGEEAVRWARQASALLGDENPEALLTLAEALAEAGRFEEAVAAARRACELAERPSRPRLAAEAARRIELYTAGRTDHVSP